MFSLYVFCTRLGHLHFMRVVISPRYTKLFSEFSQNVFSCPKPRHQIDSTDMQEKAKARLCEPHPAARGSLDTGFTQPSINLFLHFCIKRYDEGPLYPCSPSESFPSKKAAHPPAWRMLPERRMRARGEFKTHSAEKRAKSKLVV